MSMSCEVNQPISVKGQVEELACSVFKSGSRAANQLIFNIGDHLDNQPLSRGSLYDMVWRVKDQFEAESFLDGWEGIFPKYFPVMKSLRSDTYSRSTPLKPYHRAFVPPTPLPPSCYGAAEEEDNSEEDEKKSVLEEDSQSSKRRKFLIVKSRMNRKKFRCVRWLQCYQDLR